MDRFEYKAGKLYCEKVRIEDIVEQVGTPVYIYSSSTIIDHYRKISKAFAEVNPIICYSIKCNSNIHICKLLAKEGSGFDIVSGGELYRAIQAGGNPSKMVYAGVGKTDSEINQGLDAGIGWFNIESVAELENIQKITSERKISTKAALRINPDIEPNTHKYTATGKKHSKFGVDIEHAKDIIKRYSNHPFVELTGVHIHIGSPINSVKPYIDAITKILKIIKDLRSDGFKIDTFDIGGGFGADYVTEQAPLADDYAKQIIPLIKDEGFRNVILEPGRSITANAGILVTRVLYIKESAGKKFAIVDAGMNDLIRPAFYDAFHFIWPVNVEEQHLPNKRKEILEDMEGLVEYDVVGPICETGDFFAKGRKLPELKRGDLLAIFSAGAYGFSMSSQYNSRPRAPEVLVQNELSKLIRRRETYHDLILPEIFD